MVDWFRRFGDIAGVTFTTPPDLDPSTLPGYGVVPEIRVYDFEGRRQETLMWPASDGGLATSPAKSRTFANQKDATAAELLKRCYEGLEVPGEARDYHFLIQACADAVWRRRRGEPEALEAVEKLCWHDIQLIEARPETIRYDSGDEPRFLHVLTFGILIDLYKREGYLHEALDVTERAARFGQGSEAHDQLVERIATVENEDRA